MSNPATDLRVPRRRAPDERIAAGPTGSDASEDIPAGAAAPEPRQSGRTGLGREAAIRAIGTFNHLCGGLALLVALLCVALRVYHSRLSPNPQGLIFSLIVEAGRLVDLLGLGWLLGAPQRLPKLAFFTNANFVDAYLTTLSAVHLVAAGACFAIGAGLRRFENWARWAELALASASSLLVATSCLLAPGGRAAIGAAVALIPSAWVAYLLFSPRGRAVFSTESRRMREESPGPRPRPRFGMVLAMLLAMLALGWLLWFDWSTIQVAIAIRDLMPN